MKLAGVAAALTLAVGGCGPPFSPLLGPFGGKPGEPRLLRLGGDEVGLMFDGRMRTAVLHVPSSYLRNTPAPLVVVLHGGWGTGEQVARDLGFSELAERHGFVVAYPDGIGRTWNGGRGAGIS